jgi:hypothetical protein
MGCYVGFSVRRTCQYKAKLVTFVDSRSASSRSLRILEIGKATRTGLRKYLWTINHESHDTLHYVMYYVNHLS